MSLQYVGGTTGYGAGTGYNVSLTSLTGGLASAPAKGDVVLVFYGSNTQYATNLRIQVNGYYPIVGSGIENGTKSSAIVGYMKVMGATPDTSVNITPEGGNTTTTVIHVWRGIDTITQQDVTAVITSAVGSTSINNGAVTPVTAGSVVIIAGNIGANDSYTVSTTPSGYTNKLEATYKPLNAHTTVIASKAWTSGAEDPATWVMNATTSDVSWVGSTIVLRPATNATVVTQGISTITSTTITPRAQITSTGNTPITRQGFCYVQHASSTPTVSDSTAYTDGLFWGGSYTKQITGLTGGLNYRIRPYIITGVGTFYGDTISVIPSSDVPYKQYIDANILAIAGGGSGGSGSNSYGTGGGGGGAGGYYHSIIGLLNQTASYNIVIGNGGAGLTGQTSTAGNNGQDTTLFNLIVKGGGGGGLGSNSGTGGANINGNSGGSSGGAGGANSEVGLSPQLIVGQGNIGGLNLSTESYQASGGGGAGAAGTDTTAGIGLSNSISGSAVYYAGGGGGGYNGMVGGLGGGGTGGTEAVQATSGTANTGGGGGGADDNAYSGAGGSGVVIISYPTGSLIATGGTITTSGGNTIHTFNSSGTFSTTQTATSNFFQLLM